MRQRDAFRREAKRRERSIRRRRRICECEPLEMQREVEIRTHMYINTHRETLDEDETKSEREMRDKTRPSLLSTLYVNYSTVQHSKRQGHAQILLIFSIKIIQVDSR